MEDGTSLHGGKRCVQTGAGKGGGYIRGIFRRGGCKLGGYKWEATRGAAARELIGGRCGCRRELAANCKRTHKRGNLKLLLHGKKKKGVCLCR